MKVSTGLATIAAVSTFSVGARPQNEHIKHLVQFGDSYTGASFAELETR
jgi:hypothetical protein